MVVLCPIYFLLAFLVCLSKYVPFSEQFYVNGSSVLTNGSSVLTNGSLF